MAMKPKRTRKFYVEWNSSIGWWSTAADFVTLAQARRDAEKRARRWKEQNEKWQQRIVELVSVRKVHKV